MSISEVFFTKEEIEKMARINSDNPTFEDYEAFFSVFEVSLKNKDGSYKTMLDVFKEANKNYLKRKQN